MRRAWLIGAVRALAAVVVFVSPALWELVHNTSLTSIAKGDFWWHLSTGLGILQMHALPHSGWFSQSAALPWMASSWLYDVLVAVGYRLLDLRFVPLLAVISKFALAVLLFVLAGGLRGRFWTAIVLSAVAQYVLGQMPPLPVFCSVLALAIELMLLFDFRRRGLIRSLYFLPLLFLVWANLDVHFVYGILTLLLLVAVCTAERWAHAEGIVWLGSGGTAVPIKALLSIAAASIIATCVTPYGWNAYGVFWTNATSAANAYFPDYQSLRFRTPQDYVLMLLTMAAFLSLGIRRSRDLFQIGLLALCTIAAFHAQRDTWLVVLAAVAVIANGAHREASSFEPRVAVGAAVASAILLLVVVALRLPGREAVLAKIGEGYPVAAADYIRTNKLPAPLFNPYPWGGFLTWYLPQYPVAIDGRTDLYGADFNIQYAKVANFEAHYSTFPPLNDAATILLDKNSPMGKALPSARGFKMAYSDNVAVVLLRDRSEP